MSAQAGEDPATLLSARAARARGWRPVPLDHPHAHGDARDDQKHPTGCTGSHDRIPCDGERGKHPCGNWGTQSATPPSDGMLQLWFGNQPRNIGIACGPSGLVVLDEDELDALADLAEMEGHALPRTYRVRTRRGWHYYFTPPPGRVVGNRPGALKPHHIDVRGGKGAGGYVVGAGSLHASGHVYAAEDESVAPALLPDWIIDLIDAETEDEPREGWTDDVRYGTPIELINQFEQRCKQLRTPGFRYSLFNAARDGWRLVGAGVLDEVTMLGQLRDAVVRVWGAGPDARDRRIVYDEAKAAAEQSPWQVIAEPQEIGDHTEYTVGGDGAEGAGEAGDRDDGLTAEERHARKVADEVERLSIRREAERTLAARDQAPLTVLAADQFLEAPLPDYLVRDLLYRDSTAKVYGPPGGTKSYFLLDLALHLATGKEWHGRKLERTRVHYVMAEGQAVNALRTLGWLAHHGVEREELLNYFTAIPQGVLLTPEGIARYLGIVRVYGPGLVILDTKNRMMVGEENSASDVAVMVRAMDAIKDASGACVCLVDHTGLLDQTRGRGSNAVTAAMDIEIRVSRDDDGTATAEVTRDKAAEPGARIAYRLRGVPEVPRPEGVRAPAVCEPFRPSELPFDELASEAYRAWADPTLWELPTDVLTLGGKGKAAIPAVARYMRHEASNVSEVGRTRKEMVKDLMKLGIYKDDTVLRNAWDRLVSAESRRIQNVNTNSMTAASHWIAKSDDPEPRGHEDAADDEA